MKMWTRLSWLRILFSCGLFKHDNAPLALISEDPFTSSATISCSRKSLFHGLDLLTDYISYLHNWTEEQMIPRVF